MKEATFHFIGIEIQVDFDIPPVRQKTPCCPDGFTWEGKPYRVVELISEWRDFTRRGRMARNMRPSHAEAALERGSLGVGRFYFRVRTKNELVFDLYYDRAIKDVDDRLGHWFLYRQVMGGDQRDTS